MGIKRTTCAGAAVILLSLPAAASAAQSFDLVREFANCTGRYSALMEHQRLLYDPASGRTEARRNSFADLLEAVQPREAGREVLTWRIEAKVAQAALFRAADFATDDRTRRDAQTLADRHIAACDMLILGS
ncbi:hypothetical protein [Pseudoruegeria sp. HB172150]|uniref:hypothetical protein n=1 Tax=Pseudoruegeria sp. HB172150 TaxID=2721164 RepID=UPI001554CA40|nr:hypothetical protein [Pseudoruegeria sp. HB172150]